MSSKGQLGLQIEADHRLVASVAVFDPKWVGRRAQLQIEHVAQVKGRSSPIHARRTLLQQTLHLRAGEQQITVRLEPGQYAHTGQQLDLRFEAELCVDDGVLFDSTLHAACSTPSYTRAPQASCPKVLVEPPDRFSFWANLKAIPLHNRFIVLGLAVVAGLIIAINTVVGIHDQSVAPSQTWFYAQQNSDGEAQSPFLAALITSGILGGLVWFAMRSQLRRYMRLELRRGGPRIDPDTAWEAARIISGQARVALEGVLLRVVAYNLECGQYSTGSGKDRKTHRFREPIRAVLLWEQRIAHLAAGQPLQSVLEGAVVFAPIFEALLPPCSIGSSHGIALEWELQLIHPEFVDHEIEGATDLVRAADFRP